MVNLGTTIYNPTTPMGYWLANLSNLNELLNLAEDLPEESNFAQAKSAIMIVELSGSHQPNDIVARFIEDDIIVPTAGFGVPLTNRAIYEIKPSAIKKFKIAKAIGGSTVLYLHFQFYI
jgi:hypothetical protein